MPAHHEMFPAIATALGAGLTLNVAAAYVASEVERVTPSVKKLANNLGFVGWCVLVATGVYIYFVWEPGQYPHTAGGSKSAWDLIGEGYHEHSDGWHRH